MSQGTGYVDVLVHVNSMILSGVCLFIFLWTGQTLADPHGSNTCESRPAPLTTTQAESKHNY